MIEVLDMELHHNETTKQSLEFAVVCVFSREATATFYRELTLT
jgi:hypothetical protein